MGRVRANRGAAGIDRITLADVEQYGSARLLDELAADLRDGHYRPLRARRVFIPKPGSQERRPLATPAIRDRIVDRHLLKLLRAILRAGVMEEGRVRRSVSGTPQGGVISPLLY